MKKETKELVEFIKQQMDCVKDEAIKQNAQSAWWFCEYDKAIKFLDSLPEIELHLCRGGYIQDKNGTPCCDGDQLKCVLVACLQEDWFYGKLVWNAANGAFEIYTNTNTYTVTCMSWFEKVEK